MFWNSVDPDKGFRIVADRVIHITSINTNFNNQLFRKCRNQIYTFNTYATPNCYLVRKWYKNDPTEE